MPLNDITINKIKPLYFPFGADMTYFTGPFTENKYETFSQIKPVSFLLQILNKPSCKPLENWSYTCLREEIILSLLAHGTKIWHILSDKGDCTNVYVVRSMSGVEIEWEHLLVRAKIRRMRRLRKMK
jgi:hypothetical protein